MEFLEGIRWWKRGEREKERKKKRERVTNFTPQIVSFLSDKK